MLQLLDSGVWQLLVAVPDAWCEFPRHRLVECVVPVVRPLLVPAPVQVKLPPLLLAALVLLVVVAPLAVVTHLEPVAEVELTEPTMSWESDPTRARWEP